MSKFYNTLAVSPETSFADKKPAKFYLQTARLHLSAHLCSKGLVKFAYPQTLITDLLGAQPVISVAPNRIACQVPRTKPFEVLRRRRFFVGGDWDRDLPLYALNHIYKIMRDLLAEPDRERLGDSPAFKRIRTMLDANRPVTRRGKVLETDEHIIEYLNRRLDLRDSLLKNGFRANTDPGDADIGLAVGADGQLHHFSHGKHRLALSQLMDLDSVRAKIRIVHPQWYIAQCRRLSHMSAGEALVQGLRDLSLSGALEESPG